MTVQQLERRVERRCGRQGMDFSAGIIRCGLLVQRYSGTVSAVEYLKTKGVDAHVIARVLSGAPVRLEDRLATDPNGGEGR